MSESVTTRDGTGNVHAEAPAVVSAARSYTYQVHVRARPGKLRRWRGRVITVDGQGRRHHWPWRSARSRQKLVSTLWEEAMRDIQWRTGGSSVQIVEVET